MLRRGNVAWDEINYMSGPEFEKFMADFLRRQGYAVEETPLSGDQGVDLILPEFDGKRVVVGLRSSAWAGVTPCPRLL
jgi:HJR/Mrr/RecB family endonuclease